MQLRVLFALCCLAALSHAAGTPAAIWADGAHREESDAAAAVHDAVVIDRSTRASFPDTEYSAGATHAASELPASRFAHVHSRMLASVIACHRPADMVFLVDSSGSIGSTNFQKVRDLVRDIASFFELGTNEGPWAGVNVFSSGGAEWQLPLKYQYSTPTFTTGIQSMPFKNGGTNTADGISAATTMLLTQGRPASMASADLVLIITDGQSNDVTSTVSRANAARAAGINVAVATIGSSIYFNAGEISGMVGGDMTLTFAIEQWSSLATKDSAIMQRFTKIMCDAPVRPLGLQPVAAALACNDSLPVLYSVPTNIPVTLRANITTGDVMLCFTYSSSVPHWGNITSISSLVICRAASPGLVRIATTTAFPADAFPRVTSLHVAIFSGTYNNTCGGRFDLSAFNCSVRLYDARFGNESWIGSPTAPRCAYCPRGFAVMPHPNATVNDTVCARGCPPGTFQIDDGWTGSSSSSSVNTPTAICRDCALRCIPVTPTPTATSTSTATSTNTASMTATSTSTASTTATASLSASATVTASETPSQSATATASATYSPPADPACCAWQGAQPRSCRYAWTPLWRPGSGADGSAAGSAPSLASPECELAPSSLMPLGVASNGSSAGVPALRLRADGWGICTFAVQVPQDDDPVFGGGAAGAVIALRVRYGNPCAPTVGNTGAVPSQWPSPSASPEPGSGPVDPSTTDSLVSVGLSVDVAGDMPAAQGCPPRDVATPVAVSIDGAEAATCADGECWLLMNAPPAGALLSITEVSAAIDVASIDVGVARVADGCPARIPSPSASPSGSATPSYSATASSSRSGTGSGTASPAAAAVVIDTSVFSASATASPSVSLSLTPSATRVPLGDRGRCCCGQTGPNCDRADVVLIRHDVPPIRLHALPSPDSTCLDVNMPPVSGFMPVAHALAAPTLAPSPSASPSASATASPGGSPAVDGSVPLLLADGFDPDVAGAWRREGWLFAEDPASQLIDPAAAPSASPSMGATPDATALPLPFTRSASTVTRAWTLTQVIQLTLPVARWQPWAAGFVLCVRPDWGVPITPGSCTAARGRKPPVAAPAARIAVTLACPRGRGMITSFGLLANASTVPSDEAFINLAAPYTYPAPWANYTRLRGKANCPPQMLPLHAVETGVLRLELAQAAAAAAAANASSYYGVSAEAGGAGCAVRLNGTTREYFTTNSTGGAGTADVVLPSDTSLTTDVLSGGNLTMPLRLFVTVQLQLPPSALHPSEYWPAGGVKSPCNGSSLVSNVPVDALTLQYHLATGAALLEPAESPDSVPYAQPGVSAALRTCVRYNSFSDTYLHLAMHSAARMYDSPPRIAFLRSSRLCNASTEAYFRTLAQRWLWIDQPGYAYRFNGSVCTRVDENSGTSWVVASPSAVPTPSSSGSGTPQASSSPFASIGGDASPAPFVDVPIANVSLPPLMEVLDALGISVTASPTPSASPSAAATGTPTTTESVTSTQSGSATSTASASGSSSSSGSATAAETPSSSATGSSSITGTATGSGSGTPTYSSTMSGSRSGSFTPSSSASSIAANIGADADGNGVPDGLLLNITCALSGGTAPGCSGGGGTGGSSSGLDTTGGLSPYVANSSLTLNFSVSVRISIAACPPGYYISAAARNQSSSTEGSGIGGVAGFAHDVLAMLSLGSFGDGKAVAAPVQPSASLSPSASATRGTSVSASGTRSASVLPSRTGSRTESAIASRSPRRSRTPASSGSASASGSVSGTPAALQIVEPSDLTRSALSFLGRNPLSPLSSAAQQAASVLGNGPTAGLLLAPRLRITESTGGVDNHRMLQAAGASNGNGLALALGHCAMSFTVEMGLAVSVPFELFPDVQGRLQEQQQQQRMAAAGGQTSGARLLAADASASGLPYQPSAATRALLSAFGAPALTTSLRRGLATLPALAASTDVAARADSSTPLFAGLIDAIAAAAEARSSADTDVEVALELVAPPAITASVAATRVDGLAMPPAATTSPVPSTSTDIGAIAGGAAGGGILLIGTAIGGTVLLRKRKAAAAAAAAKGRSAAGQGASVPRSASKDASLALAAAFPGAQSKAGPGPQQPHALVGYRGTKARRGVGGGGGGITAAPMGVGLRNPIAGVSPSSAVGVTHGGFEEEDYDEGDWHDEDANSPSAASSVAAAAARSAASDRLRTLSRQGGTANPLGPDAARAQLNSSGSGRRLSHATGAMRPRGQDRRRMRNAAGVVSPAGGAAAVGRLGLDAAAAQAGFGGSARRMIGGASNPAYLAGADEHDAMWPAGSPPGDDGEHDGAASDPAGRHGFGPAHGSSAVRPAAGPGSARGVTFADAAGAAAAVATTEGVVAAASHDDGNRSARSASSRGGSADSAASSASQRGVGRLVVRVASPSRGTLRAPSGHISAAGGSPQAAGTPPAPGSSSSGSSSSSSSSSSSAAAGSGSSSARGAGLLHSGSNRQLSGTPIHPSTSGSGSSRALAIGGPGAAAAGGGSSRGLGIIRSPSLRQMQAAAGGGSSRALAHGAPVPAGAVALDPAAALAHAQAAQVQRIASLGIYGSGAARAHTLRGATAAALRTASSAGGSGRRAAAAAARRAAADDDDGSDSESPHSP